VAQLVHVHGTENRSKLAIAAIVPNLWFLAVKGIVRTPRHRPHLTDYVQASRAVAGGPCHVCPRPASGTLLGRHFISHPSIATDAPGFPVLLDRIAQARQDEPCKEFSNRAQNVYETNCAYRPVDPARGIRATDRSPFSRQRIHSFRIRPLSDSKLGGFGSAPKFSSPSPIRGIIFSLRYAKTPRHPDAARHGG